MTTTEIKDTIDRLNEWEEIAKQANEMVESLKDSIKSEMVARDTEELDVGCAIIRYTSVLTNRFDTKSFKVDFNDLYQQYTKQIASRRFSISA